MSAPGSGPGRAALCREVAPRSGARVTPQPRFLICQAWVEYTVHRDGVCPSSEGVFVSPVWGSWASCRQAHLCLGR